ncbi:MAG: adenosylmethionine--8-amino-7-oxononanoate transaminase [Candidatus Endonucleobacter sp. (ex Gigantidas childressi)]|nr:adenosylmethionine--8-amino-7-oxononanoate transaminase [Candidatus Endonucleobacter sp. (ex Gigantidas childressi)]
MISDQDMTFDANHIWHPYSSMIHRTEVLPVVSAKGVRLKLSDGRELIDGMSSWWCKVHGYNHPELNLAIKTQVDQLAHVMFGGLTHKPAIDLARKLVNMTPKSIDTVFFADSGSVAVEIAIKMSMQYWQARGQSGKNKMLTIRGGYYGDTSGAMAVCDPDNGMHHWFSGILPKHHFLSRPLCTFAGSCEEEHTEELKKELENKNEQIAAVIIEPIVQGAGGMYFYSPDYLRKLRSLCNEYSVLLIHDEIATGFGRTGKLFAMEHADIIPDIMCVGKALTGGYMTLAATLCTKNISTTISEQGAFMHGPTFMANPLACAAANASLNILMTGAWREQVQNIERHLQRGLQPCSGLSAVANVRVLGAIGVVEMKKPVVLADIQQEFVKRGIWVRPFGRLVYIMPPYIISDADLERLCVGILDVVSTYTNSS